MDKACAALLRLSGPESDSDGNDHLAHIDETVEHGIGGKEGSICRPY